jgi:hypothetical protein
MHGSREPEQPQALAAADVVGGLAERLAWYGF